MGKRPKWKNELHLLDLTCVPQEQIERAKILERICEELCAEVSPTTKMEAMAREATKRLREIDGDAGRKISAKTLQRIWYDWKNGGKDIITIIDKRYLKLHIDRNKRPVMELHPEVLAAEKGQQMINWDEFATYSGDILNALQPLGKWHYLLGRSRMFSDTQYDKLMRSALYSFVDNGNMPKMPQEAKVQFFYRLMWAFYGLLEIRDKQRNAQVSMNEAVGCLADLISREWHKHAFKGVYKYSNLTHFFEDGVCKRKM